MEKVEGKETFSKEALTSLPLLAKRFKVCGGGGGEANADSLMKQRYGRYKCVIFICYSCKVGYPSYSAQEAFCGSKFRGFVNGCCCCE